MKGARQMQAANVRLPDELMRWLRHRAVDNKRSLTGEIHHRLEQSRTVESGQTNEKAFTHGQGARA